MTDTTSQTKAPSAVRATLTSLTAMLALLTCPCHVPILIFLFSGTAADTFLEQSLGRAVLLLLPVFILSPIATWRLLSPKENNQ
jgi:mercuric ion transport protein